MPPLRQNAGAVAEIRQIFSLIQPQLDAVEATIGRQAEAFDPAVRGYVGYACATSGKRLRPALALLAAGATGGMSGAPPVAGGHHRVDPPGDPDPRRRARRRGETPRPAHGQRALGQHISVLLGDCLFAHALDLATNFDDAEVSRRIARAATAVCTGEILQTQRRFDLNLSLRGLLPHHRDEDGGALRRGGGAGRDASTRWRRKSPRR